MTQLFEQAKKHDLNHVYIAGDVFDARKNQSLDMLMVWQSIIDNAQFQGVEIRCIAGNHDKKDYTSHSSYLTPFAGQHLFTLKNCADYFQISKDTLIWVIPYFDEKSEYSKQLEGAIRQIDNGPSKYKHILITHIAVDGVKNNDGSVVTGGIASEMFDKFDLVLVGHYHDRSQIGDKIHYIGSIAQNNYGESQKKGFCVIYKDMSIKYIQSDFKKYETVNINMDTLKPAQMKKLKKEYGGVDHNVKFKISGSKEKIQALDKTDFDAIGISISVEYKDVSVEMDYSQAENFEGFDRGEILEEWNEFADKEEEIDKSEGKALLQNCLLYTSPSPRDATLSRMPSSA